MKYKVGDKVKVREKLVPETNFGGVYFGINMREYKGKEAIVKKLVILHTILILMKKHTGGQMKCLNL